MERPCAFNPYGLAIGHELGADSVERSLVVPCSHQPSPVGEKNGARRSAKKCCRLDNFLERKHLLGAQEVEQVGDGWDMDVVDDEQRVSIEMLVR